MSQALDLVDDLIQMEIERDKLHKQLMISLHRGEYAVGDSAMLVHLRNLRELILKEQTHPVILGDSIKIGSKNLNVSLGTEEPQENTLTCCGGGCGCHNDENTVFVQSDGGGLIAAHVTDLPDYPRDGS